MYQMLYIDKYEQKKYYRQKVPLDSSYDGKLWHDDIWGSTPKDLIIAWFDLTVAKFEAFLAKAVIF